MPRFKKKILGDGRPTGYRWWRAIKSLIRVSAERRTVVLTDIALGSIPSVTYYVLLGISGLIAGFGLLSNSAAVVVGAMLVSPLMTPIFGIAVALVTGDAPLLRRAMIAEFGGVALLLMVTFILGIMPFSLEITPEMLARTRPNLLDLLVAVLAGFAGCLAMLDERISPALPGVAIATSLTPPLATSGLSLAFGAYDGSWGSFLLFFANFLAILVVAAILFSFSGLVVSRADQSRGEVIRRFLTPAISLVAVSILLTHYLLGMIDHWQMQKTANRVIAQELANEPSTAIEKVLLDKRDNAEGVNILAVISTPRVIDPDKVKAVEKSLADALQKPVHMFFRCTITYDVTAAGSANLMATPNLDGAFTDKKLPDDVRIVQIAEQVVRERLSDLPHIDLREVRLLKFPGARVVLVSIFSPREPLPEGVAAAEQSINDRIAGDEKIKLLVRVMTSTDMTDKGRLLLGQAHMVDMDEGQAALQQRLEKMAGQEIRNDGGIVLSLDAAKVGSKWQIRAEVIGPRLLSPKEIAAIEATLARQTQVDVELTVMAKVEAVVNGSGYYSAMDLIRMQKKKATLP